MGTETATAAVPRIPRINQLAPDFEARSTQGMIRLNNDTSKRKGAMLFSHPAHFTPVCTTEFEEFAHRTPDFESRNGQLIGNSIDRVYSFAGWWGLGDGTCDKLGGAAKMGCKSIRSQQH